MADIVKDAGYRQLLKHIKQRIQGSQIKAAIKVNVELLALYWDLARMIVRKQEQASWGDGLIAMISNDLKNEFPGMKGFSRTNLLYIKKWYLFYSGGKVPQLVGQTLELPNLPQPVGDSSNPDDYPAVPEIFHIPWGHNREIITKCKSVEEALFYVRQTLGHNWSRSVLVHQIESGLIHRTSKAVTNFKTRLPAPQSDLANQTLKDPYCFDFLNLTRKHDEKELEDALMDRLTRFLLELGTGFA